MSDILQSASKIVLIIVTLALVGLTGFGIIDGKDFVQLAGMVFAFYFGQKVNVPSREEIEIRRLEKE